jgi:hypothetical protein
MVKCTFIPQTNLLPFIDALIVTKVRLRNMSEKFIREVFEVSFLRASMCLNNIIN